MRKQSIRRRVVVAALIGAGLALVGVGAVHADDATWTLGHAHHAAQVRTNADATWTYSAVKPADATWTLSVMTPSDATWT